MPGCVQAIMTQNVAMRWSGSGDGTLSDGTGAVLLDDQRHRVRSCPADGAHDGLLVGRAVLLADGVTVNVLAPGFIETAMLPGDPHQLAKTTPIGRVGRPEEVADLALAILRNGYINSQVFSIDGGMHPR